MIIMKMVQAYLIKLVNEYVYVTSDVVIINTYKKFHEGIFCVIESLVLNTKPCISNHTPYFMWCVVIHPCTSLAV